MFTVEVEKSRVRKKLILLVFFLATLGAIFGGLWIYRDYQEKKMVTYFYSENNESLMNPARGFYTQISYKEPERLQDIRKDGQTLSLVTMSLAKHMEEPIPEEKLELLKTLFEEARKQQVMLLFRAAYRQNESLGEPELSVIKTHIEQLSAIINEYKDVVLVVQAGMVGLWGEWHGSVYLKDEDALRNEAMKVVEWWLQYLDPSIHLNLRRPLFIRTAIEVGLDGSRLGMHNDALLATDSDMGTYLDREEELAWCEENLNGKVNGGEMPYLSEYTEPKNAAKEFDKLSLTYLNAYYNVEVLKDWKKQTLYNENALQYMEKHLGYRYYVEEISTTEKIYRTSDKIQIRIQLGNSGFSSIQRRFQLYLVLNDGEEKRFIPLEKLNDDKETETYQCSVELQEKKPFLIGLCYADAVNAEEGSLQEYVHTVKFANDEMRYEEGVHYFISYQYIDEEKEELVPQKVDEKE